MLRVAYNGVQYRTVCEVRRGVVHGVPRWGDWVEGVWDGFDWVRGAVSKRWILLGNQGDLGIVTYSF